ncbi:MAG: hypothetical protein OXH94_10010 [Rhodospirillales bacterium]|nr:hypothetical protein [Rhodospirillales bacterium]
MKLPVFATVGQSYVQCFRNWDLVAAHAAVIWIFFVATAWFLLNVLGVADLIPGDAEQTDRAKERMEELSNYELVFDFVWWAIFLLLLTPFATAWHRRFALGRKLVPATQALRFGKLQASVFAKLIVLLVAYFVTFALAIVVWLILAVAIGLAIGELQVPSSFQSIEFHSNNPLVVIPGALLALFLIVTVSLRIWSVLPARALGQPLGLVDSWKLMRGNTIRMFWIFLFCMLIAYIPMVVIGLVFINSELALMVLNPSAIGFSTIAIGLIVVAIFYAWLIGVILSVLSIVHGRLTEAAATP